MNKEELLQFLEKKKVATAPVAIAEEYFRECDERADKAASKWMKTIFAFAGLAVIWLLMGIIGKNFHGIYFDHNGNIQLGGLGGTILWGSVAGALEYIKTKKYLNPAIEVFVEAKEKLQAAKRNPDYMNEAKDFPAKFYNYSDIYYLKKFISEGRADDLKEAYNLLETHHFQQDQMAIQEEIRSLQKDALTAARANAAASAVTAYHTGRAAKSLKDINKKLY